MSNDPLFQPYFDRARVLAGRLCRQPSVAAQGVGMAEAADLTESLLQEAGFSTRRFSLNGLPPAIYGERRGRSDYTLLLYNHYDVQPAEPLDLWDSPPFELTERDHKLYARGISDNKGEIAARLAAIQALTDIDGELPITVRWIIEGEEEIGSAHFGEIVAPHAELLRADGCFWEGSGFDSKTGRPQVSLGTKGMLYVEMSVECLKVDAHSAAAATLPSAAWRLLGALSSLRSPDGQVRIPGFYDAIRGTTQEDRDLLADQSDMEREMRAMYGIDSFIDGLTGVALRERASFGPTCNLAGIVSGYTGEGVKTVLPGRATCKVDFRLVPDQDPETIAQALRQHLDDGGYADVQLTVLGAAEPVRTSPDHPFVRRVLDIAATFNGNPPQVTPIIGGTLPLLGPLRRLVGVPGLMAPTNAMYWGSKAHAPNEHVRIADLNQAVACSVHLLRGLGMSG